MPDVLPWCRNANITFSVKNHGATNSMLKARLTENINTDDVIFLINVTISVQCITVSSIEKLHFRAQTVNSVVSDFAGRLWECKMPACWSGIWSTNWFQMETSQPLSDGLL